MFVQAVTWWRVADVLKIDALPANLSRLASIAPRQAVPVKNILSTP